MGKYLDTANTAATSATDQANLSDTSQASQKSQTIDDETQIDENIIDRRNAFEEQNKIMDFEGGARAESPQNALPLLIQASIRTAHKMARALKRSQTILS